MFQNLHWAIPFFIGFLSAVTIWIGLGVIRFWIDIRKTKKAILANDLIADYSALSAAQKIALGKIEDIGHDGANVSKFMKVLKQVRSQNFLSAFDAVASTISQIIGRWPFLKTKPSR